MIWAGAWARAWENGFFTHLSERAIQESLTSSYGLIAVGLEEVDIIGVFFELVVLGFDGFLHGCHIEFDGLVLFCAGHAGNTLSGKYNQRRESVGAAGWGFCWCGGAGTSLYTWPLLMPIDWWYCLLLAERVVPSTVMVRLDLLRHINTCRYSLLR